MKWIHLARNMDQQQVLAKVFCVVVGELLYVITGPCVLRQPCFDFRCYLALNETIRLWVCRDLEGVVCLLKRPETVMKR